VSLFRIFPGGNRPLPVRVQDQRPQDDYSSPSHRPRNGVPTDGRRVGGSRRRSSPMGLLVEGRATPRAQRVWRAQPGGPARRLVPD